MIIPMITPFRNNQIDREALLAFISYAEKNKFDGIFAASSTGGFASLSFEQHREFLRWVMELSQGIDLFAGVTRSSLDETIRMTKSAVDLGYEKIVAINPFYHKYSQESIIRFYDEVIGNCDHEVYAYNNPSLSGNEILPETMGKIREKHDNLAGIKDSGNNMQRFKEFMKIPGIKIYQGKDALLYESLKLGATGGVCSSANFSLNTLRLAKNSTDSPSIAERTAKLMDLLSRYETPSIQNYLFRTQILGEKNPKNYVNKPFGDVPRPPTNELLESLLVLP